MEEIIKVKSGSRFEDIASYSRLVAVGNHIYISNTAGRNPVTKEMPEGVTEQSLQAIANIESALIAAGSRLADIVAIRVFVPNPADADAVGAVLGDRFRGLILLAP
ncbi:Rid family hydrolase [Kineobactrum salinum]|uniref:Rid family hydrolase n=1 Tax=Kineobactrum salinum TaxID=2708301 RepID=UPI0018D5DDD9|nr:Rid family hydrolase [Kineobactrum salinum]